MKKNVVLIILIIGVVVAIAWSAYRFWDTTMQGAPEKIQETTSLKEATTTSTSTLLEVKNMEHLITIETNYGEIQFLTYDADAPKTVENFITLAGKGFYNNLIFHRVIKGFMIQGGDPNGTGMGGPGYQFADELNPATESYKNGYKKGVVAMANAGPNTNGSQFFIMLADYPLPNNYTIFGKVVKGQEIVDMIGNVKTDANDKPLENVVMKSVSAKLAE
jgi:cyclophilin family peptidyl-prolyl cis-trans isomerase